MIEHREDSILEIQRKETEKIKPDDYLRLKNELEMTQAVLDEIIMSGGVRSV